MESRQSNVLSVRGAKSLTNAKEKRTMKATSKLERLSNMIRGRATPSRVVTEILKDGWDNTGFSGKSCTTAAERKGLKRLAAGIRRMGLDSGSAMWRIFGGGKVQQLPLP